jgi:hypothetical protein
MPADQRFTHPDRRMLRWGWLAFAVWTVIGAAQLWHAMRAGEAAMIGVAVAAPLWAGWLLWLLWRAAAALHHAARQRAYGRWQGQYYEFDGRQIRIVFDGEAIFVAAADVFDAIGIGRRGRAPERVRQLAGRDGLMQWPGEKLLVFTERGLRAWFERRTDPVAVRFQKWFEGQVVGPRRRRDLLVSAQGEPVPPERSSGTSMPGSRGA